MPGAPGEFVQINEIARASDWGDAKRIDAIRKQQRAFNRKEFQDLLFRCYTILRDTHKMDPGSAFDTISKVLFVKMFIERSGSHGTFTVDFLDLRAKGRLPNDPSVHDRLFDSTKAYYRNDNLFAGNEKLSISEGTFRRIVKELERFDLSKTSDDIKGIAFERFLGNTFRGELGQYFTPRPVVDFVIAALDPQEGELICDPSAGSGGFLIRAFEHMRAAIAADIQAQKDQTRAAIEAQGLQPDDEADQVAAAFVKLNAELVPSAGDNEPINTRVGRLAWGCIFGCDAEARAARTAKMNMIMHGDGHGGIHHHDGLLDINGIFPGRFDIVATNPPFGSNVGKDQKVGDSDEARVPNDPEYQARCLDRYGPDWKVHHDRMVAAEQSRTKILDLFDIGYGKANRATEVVFIERYFQLLKPGGRMGVVLPDGNLNNPSLSWLRRWAEGRAKLTAIVSLPEETFRSAEATVKASLVFLTRFTEADQQAWDAAWDDAHAAHDLAFDDERGTLCAEHSPAIMTGGSADAGAIVAQLEAFGVKRLPPAWFAAPPPPYPQGICVTKSRKPAWSGNATDPKAAATLRKAYADAFTPAVAEAAEAAARTLRAALRALDERHSAALWGHVRGAFDYPVFVAAPKTVGINSTGGTGEDVANNLPRVLDAFANSRPGPARAQPPAPCRIFLCPSLPDPAVEGA